MVVSRRARCEENGEEEVFRDGEKKQKEPEKEDGKWKNGDKKEIKRTGMPQGERPLVVKNKQEKEKTAGKND